MLSSQAIGYEGFQQFLKIYLEVDNVPDHLSQALFQSFQTGYYIEDTVREGMVTCRWDWAGLPAQKKSQSMWEFGSES